MKYKKSVYQSFVLITQFGINMIVPIFLCTALGVFLDKKLELSFLTIVLFFVGALAGFRNCYIMAKKIYESDDKKHDKKTQ
ncbi:MAG: AtpZ/AtpI family protein [Lachnospiraceae bacterium]|nr:AtpZ/AtpI family protein [Lachnospiraceae bacterium]MDD6182707.1 AtpZ/AtpI family protein [Lachnospiraceae bacterium]MDD7378024.1 AtpZ/AtpI family protein [Lachnospiraceae bacterium]MDY4617006.1 AtpZ/AtpI family protein [Lachnospiraceae bacterium]MDY5774440.1 AtpZ/AtpI family protein [Lachnospiraceae bacterium]